MVKYDNREDKRENVDNGSLARKEIQLDGEIGKIIREIKELSKGGVSEKEILERLNEKLRGEGLPQGESVDDQAKGEIKSTKETAKIQQHIDKLCELLKDPTILDPNRYKEFQLKFFGKIRDDRNTEYLSSDALGKLKKENFEIFQSKVLEHTQFLKKYLPDLFSGKILQAAQEGLVTLLNKDYYFEDVEPVQKFIDLIHKCRNDNFNIQDLFSKNVTLAAEGRMYRCVAKLGCEDSFLIRFTEKYRNANFNVQKLFGEKTLQGAQEYLIDKLENGDIWKEWRDSGSMYGDEVLVEIDHWMKAVEKIVNLVDKYSNDNFNVKELFSSDAVSQAIQKRMSRSNRSDIKDFIGFVEKYYNIEELLSEEVKKLLKK